MGDGVYNKTYGGVILCTDSFTLEEVELLVKTLNKLGLVISKQQRTENVYRIYINSKSIEDLRNMVKPFMIKSMMYKIGL